MARIVHFQRMGGEVMCILSDGKAVMRNDVQGNAILNSTVEQVEGVWSVTGAGDASCEV